MELLQFEKGLNSRSAKIINGVCDSKVPFMVGGKIETANLLGENVCIIKAPNESVKYSYILEEYSTRKFKSYFLTKYYLNNYLSESINGVFISAKSKTWFLKGLQNNNLKDSILGGSFHWNQIECLYRLNQNRFMNPEFKITFLKNNKVSFSTILFLDEKRAQECFVLVDILKSPFAYTPNNKDKFIVSDTTVCVDLEIFDDFQFWTGNNFLPSETKWFPSKDYDFGEIMK